MINRWILLSLLRNIANLFAAGALKYYAIKIILATVLDNMINCTVVNYENKTVYTASLYWKFICAFYLSYSLNQSRNIILKNSSEYHYMQNLMGAKNFQKLSLYRDMNGY